MTNRKNQRVEVTKGSMTQIGRTFKEGYKRKHGKNIQRVEVTKGSMPK